MKAHRSRTFQPIVKTLMGLLLLLGIGSSSAQTELPRFEAAPCMVSLVRTQNVLCGWLHVPEAHAAPTDNRIALPVIVFQQDVSKPSRTPLILLDGGPGAHTLALRAEDFARLVTAERDLILFDQRGTGMARPALDCPQVAEVYRDGLDFVVDDAQLLMGWRECGATLSAEHDLSQYSSIASAADVAALVDVLGYEQVDLWGVSYGSRLALTVARDHPQIVRSIVLDSVYPVDVNLYTALPHHMKRAFETLFALCNQQPTCAPAYPHLEAQLWQTVEVLNESPARLMLPDDGSSNGLLVVLDGQRYVEALWQMMYNRRNWLVLPQTIDAAARGEFGRIVDAIEADLRQRQYISLGMNMAVQCREELAFTDAATLAAAWHVFPQLPQADQPSQLLLAACDAFQSEGASDLERQAVTSDVPTLLFAGALDPITSPDWAWHAAGTLANASVVMLPTGAHGSTLTDDCAQAIMAAFWDAPMDRVDAQCVDDAAFEFAAPLPAGLPLNGAPVAYAAR